MNIYVLSGKNTTLVSSETQLTKREEQILQRSLEEISQKFIDEGMVDQYGMIPQEAVELFEKLTKKKLEFVNGVIKGEFKY